MLLTCALAGCAGGREPGPRSGAPAPSEGSPPGELPAAGAGPGEGRAAQGAGAAARLEVIHLDSGDRIVFDGASLRVSSTDFAGRPVAWTRALSRAERAFLTERIDRAPFRAGPTRYENADVWDGLRLIFNVQPAGQPARGVYVENRFVEAVAELSEALDVLLPPEHRIRYRQWKEEMDAADVGE